LLRALSGETVWPPPVWLMRQAGRYLPEYQALRRRARSFWQLCMTPEFAVEATFQPIARFDFDAAIVFSDILVVPYALGQDVRYEDGEGPVLGMLPELDAMIGDPDAWLGRLDPVYEVLRRTRAVLPSGKALIGFAGAPWTLAAYMIEGRGSRDQRAAKLFAYREPERFGALLAMLVDIIAFHLGRQIEAGADCVQIFDSWAGGLPETMFDEWVVGPTTAMVAKLKTRHPGVRVIGFPRGATTTGYARYAERTGVDAVSVFSDVSLRWAGEILHGKLGATIQGNLDPVSLVVGGETLDRQTDAILERMKGIPFVFNLGHGVLPETPVAHVARLVARVRGAP